MWYFKGRSGSGYFLGLQSTCDQMIDVLFKRKINYMDVYFLCLYFKISNPLLIVASRVGLSLYPWNLVAPFIQLGFFQNRNHDIDVVLLISSLSCCCSLIVTLAPLFSTLAQALLCLMICFCYGENKEIFFCCLN